MSDYHWDLLIQAVYVGVIMIAMSAGRDWLRGGEGSLLAAFFCAVSISTVVTLTPYVLGG